MSFLDFILYVLLISFVLYVTRANKMWGVSKGTKKAKLDLRVEKEKVKKKKSAMRLSRLYIWVENNIGFTLSPNLEKDMQFYIDRLKMENKALDKMYKPSEINGLFKIIQIASLFIAIMGFIVTGSILFGIFLLGTLTPSLFRVHARSKIASEDDALEKSFPDLYLILYSKLKQGSDARLAPTLKDYLRSLDAMGSRGEDTKVIKQFVLDLRNNIEIYGDDSIAVMKLRDRYQSAMIINFCNLAVQSLKGVDNTDKLLAFKIELSNKKRDQMRERAEMLVARGKRSLIVIYAILVQFILLSWIAKFSQTGGLSNLMGF